MEAQDAAPCTPIVLVSKDVIVSSGIEGVPVTCVEAWDQSLYLGTTDGEILHFFRSGSDPNDPAYIFASKQKIYSKKRKPVSGIMLLPSISRALVVSNSTTSVFTMPEFAPSAGMSSMRDVNALSTDTDLRGKQQEIDVTVFSKTAIRVVRIGADSLSLAQNVDYPGAVAGVRKSGYALVANHERYDLLDVRNVRRISLFPISSMHTGQEEEGQSADVASKLKPMIEPVIGDEFLVTCGTRPQDPAMGMVVNVEGDISRGTIAWQQYPTSVAVDYPFVAAVVGNEVQIHSINDQSMVYSLSFASVPLVCRVSGSYATPYLPLVDKLRLVPLGDDTDKSQGDQEDVDQRLEKERLLAVNLATVSSSLMVYSAEEGVRCLVLAPRLLHLEKLVASSDIDKVVDEMETMELSTERAFVEFEYINLLVAVTYLRSQSFEDALSAWLEGQFLDPRIVIYIFDDVSVKGSLWLFNGILKEVRRVRDSFRESSSGLISSLRRRSTVSLDSPEQKFFMAFLKSWLSKREMESIQDKSAVFASVEWATLRALLQREDSKELQDFVTNDLFEIIPEAKQQLRDSGQFIILANLHSRLGETGELLQVWQDLLEGVHEDKHTSVSDGPEVMRQILETCTDSDLVWKYGLWLAEKCPNVGIKVFTSPTRAVQFEDSEIVDALKSLTDDGAWREYLKYLVYDCHSNLFVTDLAIFIVDELATKLSRNKQLARQVKHSYEDYRGLPFPKPSYMGYLRNMLLTLDASPTPGLPLVGVLKSRLDLLELLQSRQEFDVSPVLRRIEEDASDTLCMELCIIYGRLSLHSQCLDILCDTLCDYRSSLLYCQYGTVSEALLKLSERHLFTLLDVDVRRDLFKDLFQRFLSIPQEATCRQFAGELLSKWGHLLEIDFVLTKTPDSWPVEILSAYLSQKFRILLKRKNEAEFTRALSRGSCLLMKQQLHEMSKLHTSSS